MPKPELKLAASESILKTEQNGGPMKAKFKKNVEIKSSNLMTMGIPISHSCLPYSTDTFSI